MVTADEERCLTALSMVFMTIHVLFGFYLALVFVFKCCLVRVFPENKISFVHFIFLFLLSTLSSWTETSAMIETHVVLFCFSSLLSRSYDGTEGFTFRGNVEFSDKNVNYHSILDRISSAPQKDVPLLFFMQRHKQLCAPCWTLHRLVIKGDSLRHTWHFPSFLSGMFLNSETHIVFQSTCFNLQLVMAFVYATKSRII